MAEIRGEDLAALCRAIEANTDRAFGGSLGADGRSETRDRSVTWVQHGQIG